MAVVVVVAFVFSFILAAVVLLVFSIAICACTSRTYYTVCQLINGGFKCKNQQLGDAFAWNMVPSQTASVQLASLVVQPCEVRDMFSKKEIL